MSCVCPQQANTARIRKDIGYISLLYSTDITEYNLDLHGGLLELGLLNLGDLGGGLGAEGATAPVLPDLLSPLVVVGLHGLDQLVQRGAVIGLDLETE